jgi:predicted ferric reductase
MLFAWVKLIRLVTIVYLSRRSLATVQVDTNHTIIQISVRPTRTLDVRAGQFFYLNLLDFSLTSAFRSYPFQVLWADRDTNGQQVLDFIVQLRRGFTRKLLLADPRVQYKIALEGLYGRHPRLEEYVTVLMFTINTGISGYLLYMKELFALR